MTAGSLRSIYQQYKYDTDVVASWRKCSHTEQISINSVPQSPTTAKSFGYSAPLGPVPVEKKTQRPKGKARKEAKAAGAANGTPNQAPKIKCTLAVKDLVPLASHIASLKNTAIEVLDYFNAALDRVILVRSSFSQKLEVAGKAINVVSDSRHAFFVSVLEQVRDSIKPLLSADAFDFTCVHKAVPKPDASDTRNSPLQNLFEVLNVYEPSAEFLAAPDIAPPPQPSELEATVEVPDDDIFEACFATTSLMDDISRLRAEVAEPWARHHAGEVELATVSVARPCV
jgi:hypothetical protein